MKNDFVYSLNDKERKRYQLYALFSTFFGCFSDVMVDSSAILILYFAMLGADKSTVMSSTGYVAIASMLLMIPASGLVNKLGAKSVVAISSVIGMSSCLLMAAAPFFGREWACNIALVGCFAYSISKATWPVAWYVVLGNILLPSERGNFLGFMRFSYYILTGVVFWAVGYAMGSNPPEWFLQAVISVIGVMILGRTLFISMIKLPEEKTKTLELGKSFKSVIKNYALIGFSVYVCFICLAFAAVLPLTLIYMKEGLAMGDGLVQEISAFGIGGLVFGYFVYGRLVRLAGIRNVQLLVHAIYIATPLGLFFCSPIVPHVEYISGFLYVLGSFGFACFYCYLSQEILALSRPQNVSMASAFVQTYQYVGTMCARSVMMPFLLGSGALAAGWTKWDINFSQFQTLFLICACFAIFCLVMAFSLPSAVKEREDYYNP